MAFTSLSLGTTRVGEGGYQEGGPYLSSQKPVCCKEQELGELEAAGCSTISSCVNLVIAISQIVKWYEYHKMNGGWEWSLLFLFFPG